MCRSNGISFFLEGDQMLADVALTHSLLRPIAATASSGGAATEYEAVKRAKYAHLLAPTQRLVPLVFDFFGALGSSGRRTIDTIANAFMLRKGLGKMGRTIALAQINRCVILSAARLVLTNA